MEIDELISEFIKVKTYNVVTRNGKGCFIEADEVYFDDKGYLTFKRRGELVAVCNFANLAGYRIVNG